MVLFTLSFHFRSSPYVRMVGSLVLLWLAAASGWATTSRNHIWDITFPLEKGHGTYVQGWHDCRPSASTCTRAHRGVDLYATPGTPVYAAADGVIVWRQTSASSGWSPRSGSGYALNITAPGNTFRHFYGHFGPDVPGREEEAFAVNPGTGQLWKVGDTVSRGQLLGWVGISGATASGPHLHFELRSMTRGMPLDDPGPDAIAGRAYGDPNASLGSFEALRYDPYPSLVAAEQRNDYPVPPPFAIGSFVRVYDVNTALSVRGPEPCDNAIAGAGRPNGTVGRIIGGPAQCPSITSHNMWRIRWSDCVVGWSSERFLQGAPTPADFCNEKEVSVHVLGEGAVVKTPQQSGYAPGSTLQLQAVPGPEYSFSHWSGSLTSTTNPLAVTVNADLSLTATFQRTYQAWALNSFTEQERQQPGVIAPEADPFGHGVENLAVYAFGLNVRQPQRSDLPRVERADETFSLVFRRIADAGDLAYVVEISSDLAGWQPLGSEVEIEPVEALDQAREIVRVRLPHDWAGATRFVRLRLVRSS